MAFSYLLYEYRTPESSLVPHFVLNVTNAHFGYFWYLITLVWIAFGSIFEFIVLRELLKYLYSGLWVGWLAVAVAGFSTLLAAIPFFDIQFSISKLTGYVAIIGTMVLSSILLIDPPSHSNTTDDQSRIVTSLDLYLNDYFVLLWFFTSVTCLFLTFSSVYFQKAFCVPRKRELLKASVATAGSLSLLILLLGLPAIAAVSSLPLNEMQSPIRTIVMMLKAESVPRFTLDVFYFLLASLAIYSLSSRQFSLATILYLTVSRAPPDTSVNVQTLPSTVLAKPSIESIVDSEPTTDSSIRSFPPELPPAVDSSVEVPNDVIVPSPLAQPEPTHQIPETQVFGDGLGNHHSVTTEPVLRSRNPTSDERRVNTLFPSINVISGCGIIAFGWFTPPEFLSLYFTIIYRLSLPLPSILLVSMYSHLYLTRHAKPNSTSQRFLSSFYSRHMSSTSRSAIPTSLLFVVYMTSLLSLLISVLALTHNFILLSYSIVDVFLPGSKLARTDMWHLFYMDMVQLSGCLLGAVLWGICDYIIRKRHNPGSLDTISASQNIGKEGDSTGIAYLPPSTSCKCIAPGAEPDAKIDHRDGCIAIDIPDPPNIANQVTINPSEIPLASPQLPDLEFPSLQRELSDVIGSSSDDRGDTSSSDANSQATGMSAWSWHRSNTSSRKKARAAKRLAAGERQRPVNLNRQTNSVILRVLTAFKAREQGAQTNGIVNATAPREQ
ncbi:hypothetical protein BKA69DRAFT_1171858 [Paraphysoderma sedebokerense]|nr:hypothetical protein BKA69DRAFT_1171858 [Paraphysoderma sedebokerense]